MAELQAYVQVDYANLRKKIRNAQTVPEFLEIYDSNDYQAAMRRTRLAMGQNDPWEWSKDWAIRMRAEPGGDDWGLNEDRKICLLLLYELCNRCYEDKKITEAEIVTTYSAHRVVNVLQLFLPMDRAQALYKMQYPGATRFGMHWVAKQQVDEEWARLLGDGKPTMNKRILQLMNIEGLGLREVDVFRLWTAPTRYDTI